MNSPNHRTYTSNGTKRKSKINQDRQFTNRRQKKSKAINKALSYLTKWSQCWIKFTKRNNQTTNRTKHENIHENKTWKQNIKQNLKTNYKNKTWKRNIKTKPENKLWEHNRKTKKKKKKNRKKAPQPTATGPHKLKTLRANRWRAIAYPRVYQNSKCVPPVLIHRAITN